MTEVEARIATFSCLHAATDHGTAGSTNFNDGG